MGEEDRRRGRRIGETWRSDVRAWVSREKERGGYTYIYLCIYPSSYLDIWIDT